MNRKAPRASDLHYSSVLTPEFYTSVHRKGLMYFRDGKTKTTGRLLRRISSSGHRVYDDCGPAIAINTLKGSKAGLRP